MSKKQGVQVAVVGLVAVVFIGVLAYVIPLYRVYTRELNGKAQLREAEWNKQVLIEDARAKAESAKMLAEAEIERAKGVAEANRIIGDSLKDNDAYLRYLWVQGLNDGSSEVIYVPTEANLPILEASRFAKPN